jgi:hypothetical protein
MLDAQAQARRGRWRRFTWAGALAAGVGAIGIVVLVGHEPPQSVNARVERVLGTVELQSKSGLTRRVSEGEPLAPGALVTRDGGRVALLVGESLSLRLGEATHLDLHGGSHVTLRRGALYVDSKPGGEARVPLVISTPAGDVQHVGTQFRVEVEGDRTRVGVREGQIRVEPRGAPPLVVTAGEELQVSEAGEIVRRQIRPFGTDWEWAASIAPDFQIENRSAADFLVWIAREHGWALRYDSPQARALAAEAVLHGSIAGLSAEDSLQRVAAITGLSLSVADGVLTVRS